MYQNKSESSTQEKLSATFVLIFAVLLLFTYHDLNQRDLWVRENLDSRLVWDGSQYNIQLPYKVD